MPIWTKADVQRIQARQTPKARTKYGATKTTVDGIEFDSKREARRYHELKLMQQSGQIRKLRMQPHYTLCALALDGPDLRDVNAGKVYEARRPVCEYVADFEYEESHLGTHWNPVVEDVKSAATRTPLYALKKKLFEAQYGVKIREM